MKVALLVSEYQDNPVKYVSAGGILDGLTDIPGIELYIILATGKKSQNLGPDLNTRLISLFKSPVERSLSRNIGKKYVSGAEIFKSFCEDLGPDLTDQYTETLSSFIEANPNKVFRSSNLNSDAFQKNIRSKQFNLGVARGGGILKSNFISLFSKGILNLHGAGALPYYRGIGALEFALVDKQPIYMNLHYIDPGVDTGPMLEKIPLQLGGVDSLNRLYARVHRDGIREIVRIVKRLSKKDDTGQSQEKEQGRQHFIPHPFFEKLAMIELANRNGKESGGR